MKKPSASSCRVIAASRPETAGLAAAVVRSGGVVALPTETYYGLAVDPFNESAVERLFRVKERERSKPVLVLIEKVEDLGKLVRSVPKAFKPLFEVFWPGPLTLVFPANSSLPSLLTGETGTLGIRISSNRLATEICHVLQGPITATSANISGMPPARTAEEIADSIGSRIDLVIDGGTSRGDLGSAIVAEKDGELVELRAGPYDFNYIKQISRRCA